MQPAVRSVKILFTFLGIQAYDDTERSEAACMLAFAV